MTFHENLKKALEQRSMTQSEFSRLIDVQPIVVHRWVTGKVMPGGKSLQKISKNLNVSIDELLA